MLSSLLELKKITLVEWVEDEDLRRIGQRAEVLLKGKAAGEAVLVTNARFGRHGERFRVLVRDAKRRPWVLAPPRQEGLESLFVKLHTFLSETF